MARRPEEIERTVARVGVGVALTLVAFVGAAIVSDVRHPSPGAGEAVVSRAVLDADPPPMSSAGVPLAASARPQPVVREASGDPLLGTGFGQLRVAPAATYANLTVYPVYRVGARAGSGRAEFALLGEGLSNGSVMACEPGGSLRAGAPDDTPLAPASATNAQEGAEHRGANLMLVTNTSPVPTYVPDGQIDPGGGQDRGAAADTVVPAHSAGAAVAAYCVEHGRSFGPTDTFAKDVAIAIPSVRYAMQVVGEQQPVWDAVAEATRHFDARTDSGTYYALVASTTAQSAASPYADALTMPVQQAAHGAPVGVVVAINGHIVCADLYRSPALFAQLWPSLLRSYALQAAMSPSGGAAGATAHDAAQWLTALDRAPGAQTRHADLTEVARVATTQGAGTRTAAITGSGGRLALLHEAFWTRDAVLTD